MDTVKLFFTTSFPIRSNDTGDFFTLAADMALMPAHYLLGGKNVFVFPKGTYFEVTHHKTYHSSDKNFFLTSIMIILFIPGTLLGFGFKFIALFSSDHDEEFDLVCHHFTPFQLGQENQPINQKEYDENESLKLKPPSNGEYFHAKAPALVIYGHKLKIKKDDFASLNPKNLIFVGADIVGESDWTLNQSCSSVEEALIDGKNHRKTLYKITSDDEKVRSSLMEKGKSLIELRFCESILQKITKPGFKVGMSFKLDDQVIACFHSSLDKRDGSVPNFCNEAIEKLKDAINSSETAAQLSIDTFLVEEFMEGEIKTLTVFFSTDESNGMSTSSVMRKSNRGPIVMQMLNHFKNDPKKLNKNFISFLIGNDDT